MKFAKELDQELVPEWRIKYLNYKAGKKYIKAVSRAINRAHGTPSVRRSGDLPPHATPSFYNASSTPRRTTAASADDGEPLRDSPAPFGSRPVPRPQPTSKSVPIARNERQALTDAADDDYHYGSFVPTPLAQSPPPELDRSNTFELPAPAMHVPSEGMAGGSKSAMTLRKSLSRLALKRSVSMAADLPTTDGPASRRTPSVATVADDGTPRQRLKRLFSTSSPLGRRNSREYSMSNLDDVREREREFFRFLDSELDKVETFYKQKEDQAAERLKLLREQLHEMRNRRIDEIRKAKERRETAHSNGGSSGDNNSSNGKNLPWVDPLKNRLFKPGPNSKALQKMPQTPVMMSGAAGGREERRDYTRRPPEDDVPYRTAKRKLKLALQEFYRGLELLKAYALLNRKAFRKLNKKYDKAVNARPPYRFMNEKVNKSWFVNSDVLDGYITAVEDLYARYFERGNHKIAAGKLRSLSRRPGDESASSFRNGLLIGIGSVFAIQGCVEGAQLLFHTDPVLREQSSYLMQIYGGYFLMLYLFILFCLDCRLWTMNKINYPFIFEFDPRSQLDWRQLAEFPSFFVLLFGLFIWLNFSRLGSPDMFLYYPVLLIFISFVILFLPAPVLWHRSRRWFLYSHWRLFFAGLYPVEFRDFFLGDIYCSLTYATCNIELFFCLYAHYWQNPVQCNSNHSRLLGFFAALPPIWRALQCIRRYHDTKNIFPHLVNCGKYTMTITAAVCLSLYRIDNNNTNRILFIFFSTINGIYVSVWDLFMDFSLLQSGSRHFLLRDILALKTRWYYYAAMAIDPVLRFSWIFYAIFTHDTQHSTVVSFMVAFAEVTRRGMWTLFRVENEHCANVAQYKASRDVPLPYQLEMFTAARGSAELAGGGRASGGDGGAAEEQSAAPPSTAGRSTGVDVGGATPERAATAMQPTPRPEEDGGGTVRRRARTETWGKKSIGAIMAEAHRQDFEKRRKPAGEGSPRSAMGRGGALGADEDDDDDDDDEAGMTDEDEQAEREMLLEETLGGFSGDEDRDPDRDRDRGRKDAE
ncbi:uncharacterized protein E0L32_008882 [Thyridium curvatum]|uniref:Uncharacterized protein n=1 Tax=Thyridium curvatum TaxID=1093900 RepID=A0A507B022_9PEZI|nr:uncharacterized protein E0L32_008882 [Thyridium curvatum]TPX09860.1 hypothetical protein E0L32_008882 [Thyridium curvatum]